MLCVTNEVVRRLGRGDGLDMYSNGHFTCNGHCLGHRDSIRGEQLDKFGQRDFQVLVRVCIHLERSGAGESGQRVA